MNALVVGADRLGKIPGLLAEYGISIKTHLSGRDPAHQRMAAGLPANIGIVILFTDFLGHNVMRSFRDAANRNGVPLLCCRRSVCALQQALGATCCGDCRAPASGEPVVVRLSGGSSAGNARSRRGCGR
ncbi:MAG: DUF2325 domain-containing protein [Zoogloeaceae bacterium]|nr:DUF2325 domain-containing protein [Rhodocyclaceae bacterium]MCP5234570.1 DUF2325 domain-containing protein [Zoogloeaceae bacterium]